MDKKLRFGEITFGLTGQLILVIVLLFLGFNALFSSRVLFAILIIIPVAFMTMRDQTTIDVKNKRYCTGIVFFWIIDWNKWHSINDKCFLKIEPLSKVKSLDNFGSISQIKIALYLVDRSRKEKIFLLQDDYNKILSASETFVKAISINVVDFKFAKTVRR